MTRGAALLTLVLAVAAPSAAAPVAAGETVLATAGLDRREIRLVELDRGTLRPTGRSVDARGFHGAWSYSPDGTRLALSNSYVPSLGRPAGLLLVDVRGVRALKRILIPGELGFMRALTWVAPNRLLALFVPNPNGSTQVVAIDADRGRIVRRRAVAGNVVGGHSLPAGLVLLLGPEAGIGHARVVTVDAALSVRSTTLDAIRAGWRSTGAGEAYAMTQRRPGVAVDEAGRRAFVIGADEPPAEVDLATLRVTLHPVRRVQARSKSMEGPVRQAVWLGGGLLGVTGAQFDGLDPKTRRVRQRPAGLTIVDTRTWVSTLVDEAADGFGVAGTTLVVDGRGLAAYARDGRPLWTALPDRAVQVHVLLDDRIYAQVSGERGLRIFDAATGRELGRRLGAIPRLLTARSSPM